MHVFVTNFDFVGGDSSRRRAVACAVAEEDFELVAQLGAELRRLRQLNGEA